MNMFKTIAICALAALCLTACGTDSQDADDFASTAQSLYSSNLIPAGDYPSTVRLYEKNGDGNYCTGVLIDKDWVLTAATCVTTTDCVSTGLSRSNVTIDRRKNTYIRIGNSGSDSTVEFKADKFYAHPDFTCEHSDKYEIKNDLALIKLKESVPASVAVPADLIQTIQEPTSDEISKGFEATIISFGATSKGNAGYKNKYVSPIFAKCPVSEVNSAECVDSNQIPSSSNDVAARMKNTGLVFFNSDTRIMSTEGKSRYDYVNYDYIGQFYYTSGDLGAPAFITRDGKDYLFAINSIPFQFGHQLAMTHINSLRSFIAEHVTSLPDDVAEICDNGIDDNEDGLVDCDDPHCDVIPACHVEDCHNGIDDNGNGLVDCYDPECSAEVSCQIENCTNGIDDNGDGLVDCDDPHCSYTELCDPNSHVSEEPYTDCSELTCEYEGTGHECGAVCEIYYGEGFKAWCDGYGNIYCDTKDPSISGSGSRNDLGEETPVEICNDNVDNNNDGLIDCKDPSCSGTLACASMKKSDSDQNKSSCSAAPMSSHNSFAALLAMLGAAGLLGLRRRKQTM